MVEQRAHVLVLSFFSIEAISSLHQFQWWSSSLAIFQQIFQTCFVIFVLNLGIEEERYFFSGLAQKREDLNAKRQS